MEALAIFEQEKVKGIIMDLRANPGGLYDQAQKVADAFIDSGVLVSMVGVGGSQRKDEHASRNGNIKLPLAVLVNQRSASACEIVAGAVKNLDRGVVIGETTFGKGSVQMLFDIPSPVSTSGQGRGRPAGPEADHRPVPDPGRSVDPGRGRDARRGAGPPAGPEERPTRASSSCRSRPAAGRSRTTSGTSTTPAPRRGPSPVEMLSYLYVPPAAQEKREQAQAKDDEDDEAAQDRSKRTRRRIWRRWRRTCIDFPMEFARDLLAQTKSARRREMLQGAKAFFDKVRTEEDKKLAQALEKLGVDWTQGPANPAAGQVQVSLSTAGGDNKVGGRRHGEDPGHGEERRHRRRCTGCTPCSSSENPYFDENEMVFGKLAPGESKNYDLGSRCPRRR